MAAVEDVTQNLPSLQFEAALSDNEKYLLRKLTPLVIAQFVVVFNTETLVFFNRQLLYLRGRSHALTVSACAQTCVTCDVSLFLWPCFYFTLCQCAFSVCLALTLPS